MSGIRHLTGICQDIHRNRANVDTPPSGPSTSSRSGRYYRRLFQVRSKNTFYKSIWKYGRSSIANPNGDNAGCSCAFSPICWDINGKCVDNAVLLADNKTEGILYAKFDMEAIREYRNREMLGNTFRKVEAYSQLLSKEIKEPFIRAVQNR